MFPLDIAGTPYADGGEAPVEPGTPLFDAPAYLAFLAGRTTTIRLGTFVYLLALRHPLITARAFATADQLSNGRISVGVGAGWLESEWIAAGLDPITRGPRLDEAMAVTRRLWSEDPVAHDGWFWSWAPLGFEPKPVQPGGPPLLVGGESMRALRRAATLGDGWMSMPHESLASASAQVSRLDELRRGAGRADEPFEITVCILDPPPIEEIAAWSAAGVDRLIVKPWGRTRDTLEDMAAFAARYADVMER